MSDRWLGGSFQVIGVAQPQGSTRSFMRGGRVVTISDNPKVRPWRQAVAAEAIAAGAQPLDGPVSIQVTVFLPRPKGHYGRRGLLPSAPKAPAVRPDADKLLRAVLDALSGVAYHDDQQVTSLSIEKNYADDSLPPVTLITVQRDHRQPGF